MIRYKLFVLIEAFFIMGFWGMPLRAQRNSHAIAISFSSGVNLSSINSTVFPKEKDWSSDFLWELECVYQLNKQQALVVGIHRVERSCDLEYTSDLLFPSWDIPLAFVQYIPLSETVRLAFRIGLLGVMMNGDDINFKTIVPCGYIGIGGEYELLPRMNLFGRLEYDSSFSSIVSQENTFFTQKARLSDVKFLIGVQYTIKADPLRKKRYKTPDCLK